MTLEALEFDLAGIQIPVTINKKDGTKKECMLREALEDAAVKYQNARSASIVYGDDGNVSRIKNPANIEPLLVSLCLFEIVRGKDDSVINERPIQETEVRTWPSRVVSKLHEKAREISNLGNETIDSLRKQKVEIERQIEALEKEEETAKNLENDTTDTSD